MIWRMEVAMAVVVIAAAMTMSQATKNDWHNIYRSKLVSNQANQGSNNISKKKKIELFLYEIR